MPASTNGGVLLPFVGGTLPVNNIIKSCGLAAAVISLSACATITRGTSQKFNIVTTPTAANVKLSTGQTCVSPCDLKLKRKTGFVVTANKQGYKEASAVIDSRIRGGGIAGGAGNIIAGGIIGIAVDASSGAMNDLTPNPLQLTLLPLADAPAVSAIEPAPVAAAEPVAADPVVAAPVAAPAPGGE